MKTISLLLVILLSGCCVRYYYSGFTPADQDMRFRNYHLSCTQTINNECITWNWIR